MKTIKNLLIISSFLITINSFAGTVNIVLDEELPVNDIPFNTNEIAAKYLINSIGLKLEDEGYIDDIPFDTRSIAAEYLYKKAMKQKFSLEAEPFINDIPFNTWYLFNLYAQDNYALTQEMNVDDIPFDTELITARYLVSSTELQLEEEPEVHDYQAFSFNQNEGTAAVFRMNRELSIKKNYRLVGNTGKGSVIFHEIEKNNYFTRIIEKEANQLVGF